MGLSCDGTIMKILVCDDSVINRQIIGGYLQQMGHKAIYADNGQQAVELFSKHEPDLVLIDVEMPGMNGYEVAKQLRAAPWGATMLLIALTGWGQPQDKRAAEAAGFDHHVTKPFDIDALDGLLHMGSRR